MRFITVRDLRGRPRHIWQELKQAGEMVITSNGKPIAILTETSEEKLEESLVALRRARAVQAVTQLQQESVRTGKHKMPPRKINAVIKAARRERRR